MAVALYGKSPPLGRLPCSNVAREAAPVRPCFGDRGLLAKGLAAAGSTAMAAIAMRARRVKKSHRIDPVVHAQQVIQDLKLKAQQKEEERKSHKKVPGWWFGNIVFLLSSFLHVFFYLGWKTASMKVKVFHLGMQLQVAAKNRRQDAKNTELAELLDRMPAPTKTPLESSEWTEEEQLWMETHKERGRMSPDIIGAGKVSQMAAFEFDPSAWLGCSQFPGVRN